MQISTYDFFETSRQCNEWISSSLKTFWGNPVFSGVSENFSLGVNWSVFMQYFCSGVEFGNLSIPDMCAWWVHITLLLGAHSCKNSKVQTKFFQMRPEHRTIKSRFCSSSQGWTIFHLKIFRNHWKIIDFWWKSSNLERSYRNEI